MKSSAAQVVRIGIVVATLSLLVSAAPLSPGDAAPRPVATPDQAARPVTPTTSADPVVAAAGDIACDPDGGAFHGGLGTSTLCRQKAVSNLLVNAGLAAVLPLGDEQYTAGELSDFSRSYDLSWGRALGITHPTPGNHEYVTAGAAGYYDYFGTRAGQRAAGYYSYDIGRWHLIALNAQCTYVSCAPGSAQLNWLAADLAAHPTSCTLAYWHQPRFSSGHHGSDPKYDGFWRTLYAAGADIVLNGHDHDYERFAPQNPSGQADGVRGIREFVVGSGGTSHYDFRVPVANSQVRQNSTFGVLKLTLHPTSYDWSFVPESGKSFHDTGTGRCH
jgi:hypothetical protein